MNFRLGTLVKPTVSLAWIWPGTFPLRRPAGPDREVRLAREIPCRSYGRSQPHKTSGRTQALCPLPECRLEPACSIQRWGSGRLSNSWQVLRWSGRGQMRRHWTALACPQLDLAAVASCNAVQHTMFKARFSTNSEAGPLDPEPGRIRMNQPRRVSLPSVRRARWVAFAAAFPDKLRCPSAAVRRHRPPVSRGLSSDSAAGFSIESGAPSAQL